MLLQEPPLGYLFALLKGGYFIGVCRLLYSGYPNFFCHDEVFGRQIPLRWLFPFPAGLTISNESMHPSCDASEPSKASKRGKSVMTACETSPIPSDDVFSSEGSGLSVKVGITGQSDGD